ncbi:MULTISPECIES: nitrite reductase small subunit NirD [Vibrio]|jgi:nitrite reductase (NADH) small subunit|uniref:Nitrite reductase small subunit n=1 Tax=Vibrio natriegens NBRC 15636 = ATCC 14048 = DSM 759 TaxID=1219067 RepID=A0AAN0Y7R1_VIBNA|nr:MULTISPECIES: nitrite reductase small subunit NirD [Vibrio]MEE3876530.1 nitrite reductase small subunit NirD [Vibrio sp. YYF0003]WMN88949.1 nitrite reductase small subunit NirD [Vibrio parahaemolyticus]AEX24154.1 nitrite reductase [NAD(P)H] small subunit [Vibrio sp. EJY3]ALR18071.1 nitrite reductase [Vibrio natriegens NBRC 15636 = ATCC 14048 = DSM 759]ANQ15570.1 nitrite reductase small subunit [Vibrio natriegens NBRC 15636 = ATCC 14048 = DSM 759]
MSNWISICESTAIAPNTGVCAKVDDKQIAVFFSQRTNSLHAISNFDPIGKANILSRGILGCVGEILCVASPLYKQHFCLETGKCIENPEYNVPIYEVRNNNGMIELRQ